MYLKRLQLSGFKSFAKKTTLEFNSSVVGIVGPNGSGKSNVAEALRFVLGEQSIKSLRGKRGEDLIWNGSKQVARQNRATVTVIFDNTPKDGKRIFDFDFDEVSVTREVHRDGINEYSINGTRVRLKDVVHMLANARIGTSTHHIISQGEADRALFASIKERKTMVEDALGLRIYEYKITESEKKLLKTNENMREVGLLRKELMPRISFLKKQVERIEKAKALREDLKHGAREYFKREELYLKTRRGFLQNEIIHPQKENAEVSSYIEKLQKKVDEKKKGRENKHESEMRALEDGIRRFRGRRDALSRSVGRLEGMIELEESRIKEEEEVPKRETSEQLLSFSRDAVAQFDAQVNNLVDEALHASDDSWRVTVGKIREEIKKFVSDVVGERERQETADSVTLLHKSLAILRQFKEEKEQIEQELLVITDEEAAFEERYREMKRGLDREKEEAQETEKELFSLLSKRTEIVSRLDTLARERSMLEREEADFKAELQEAAILGGREVLSYSEESLPFEDYSLEPREKQYERKKKLEKIKIRIEEFGAGGGDDVLKEYEDVIERDAFFERELVDLEKTKISLEHLIKDLSGKLNAEFKNGILKINKQFQEFFTILFGGGTATLSLVRPEKKKKGKSGEEELGDAVVLPDVDEDEEGIEVSVSLPQKRLRGIQMLSGGERTLTSIALLFAISQVNPPPFLVLDETDAALDEANSRKYGEMLANLSKHTQLIIITHNRETMSRASVLYGVTAGADAASRVLSIKFEDAEGMMAR